MTARELYEESLAFIFSKSSDDKSLMDFSIVFVNMTLREVFVHNNQIRNSKGLESLTDIPSIKTWDDLIIYENEIISAMVYSVCSKFLRADEEEQMASIYEVDI